MFACSLYILFPSSVSTGDSLKPSLLLLLSLSCLARVFVSHVLSVKVVVCCSEVFVCSSHCVHASKNDYCFASVFAHSLLLSRVRRRGRRCIVCVASHDSFCYCIHVIFRCTNFSWSRTLLSKRGLLFTATIRTLFEWAQTSDDRQVAAPLQIGKLHQLLKFAIRLYVLFYKHQDIWRQNKI